MASLQRININLLFIVLIILTGILLYLPSTNIFFVNDEIAFIKRTQVGSISELAALFDKKDYDGDYYRPFVNFISGITTIIGNYNPVFYRVFNLLLHCANGIFVYYFALLLLNGIERKEIISLTGALFFISFPLNDYPVIWHTDLFDRIMTFFYLFSVIIFLKNKSWSVLSLLFFLIAALSKEMAFSLPFIILLLSFYINKNYSLKNALPYFLVLAALIIFRLIVFDNNIFNLQDAHSGGTITDAVKNLMMFAGMLVFPFFLREVQEFVSSNPLLTAATGTILFVSFIYYTAKFRKKDILFFILILLVIVLILPASRLLMRWYLYLPSAVFCIFLSYLIFTTQVRIFKSLTTALIVFLVYNTYTLYRETEWIKVSHEGAAVINDLKQNTIKNQDKEWTFITVPAKINDIPLFQLGFDHHLNHMLGTQKKISVLTKSYLYSISDSIELKDSEGYIALTQTGDNYFILSDIEKNIKFSDMDFEKDNLKRIYYTKNKEPYITIFTFYKGKFHIIKE